MSYEYKKLFTLNGNLGSLDDLSETLHALEQEFNESKAFSKKVIFKVENDFWDIVSSDIYDFKKYIREVTNDQATLTVVNRFDCDLDRSITVVNLIWKGSW